MAGRYSPAFTSRGSIALLIAAAAGANYAIDSFQHSGGKLVGFFEQLAATAGSLNVFQLFAWFVAITLLRASCQKTAASRGDHAMAFFIAAGMLATNIFPGRIFFAGLVTLAAFYLHINHRGDLRIKAAGAVFIAIAVNGVWGPAFFAFCADEFLRADAGMTGAALHFLRPDIEWNALAIRAPDGHRIIVLDQCSSFHNMTLALLCSVSMTMQRRQSWRRTDIIVAALVCVVMFLMNAARIFAMALGKDSYIFWHEGAGAAMFGLAVTLVIFATTLAALRYTETTP